MCLPKSNKASLVPVAPRSHAGYVLCEQGDLEMVEYLQGWQHRRDELGSDICVGGELPVAVASGGPGMPYHLFIIHSLTTGYAHPPSSIVSCFTCLQIT